MKVLKEHKWSLLGIFVLGIILMIPMIINPYHIGDDTPYHIGQVAAVEKSIESFGGFGNSIVPMVAKDYGYASRMLYPPLSHTVMGWMYHAVKQSGINITDVFKFTHVLILILSGISMYVLSFKLSKSKKIALFSSFIYMSFPYQLSDHYVRASMAECFLFPFLPMIFTGIISLFDGKVKSFYPFFVIGYVGAILSHFTIMLYFTVFLALFLLVYYKKVFRKEFLIPFCIATICVLGISLFYLETMVEFKLFSEIAVFQKNMMTQKVWSLLPWEFLPFSHYRDYITFGCSIIPFLLLVITIWKRKQFTFPKYSKGFIIFGVAVILVTSILFPWNKLPSILTMIQFSWRFMAFLAIIIAIFAPICLEKVHKKSSLFLLMILMIGVSLSEIHFQSDVLMNNNVEEVIESGAGLGWQREYLPMSVHRNNNYYEARSQDIIVLVGNARITNFETKTPNLSFHIDLKDKAIVELPRIFYYGYSLKMENGTQIPLKENEKAFVEAELTESGDYYLTYPGTLKKRCANFVSYFSIVASVVGYFGYLFLTRRKK